MLLQPPLGNSQLWDSHVHEEQGWLEDSQGTCFVSCCWRVGLAALLSCCAILHGSSFTTTLKKPTTYQRCRAIEDLCMLSFINIIIQGQKEVACSWLITLAAHNVGKTLALTILWWAPRVRVGKGRKSVRHVWVLTAWEQLRPTLVSALLDFFRCQIVFPIKPLPAPHLCSCWCWIYSLLLFHPWGDITCFIFLCPFQNTDSLVSWASIIIYSHIDFFCFYVYYCIYHYSEASVTCNFGGMTWDQLAHKELLYSVKLCAPMS